MLQYHLRNFVRSLVWRSPALYRPVGLMRRNSDVNDLDYHLTIEGYPRSANTFLFNVIKLTQPQLRVRSHRHIPPHVIAAVRAELPVFLLIRAPLDCVSSYAILTNTSAMPQLAYYVAYHDALRPYMNDLFIADFSSVTCDPKPALQRFAQKYHLPMDLDFDFDAVSEQAFRQIERDNTSSSGQLNERTVNRPTAARASLKSELVKEMELPANRPWLDRANTLYREFQAAAAVSLARVYEADPAKR